MNALFDLERQREDVRQCMYQMSIWNTFNPNIVKSLFNGNQIRSYNTKTINELVRLGAKREHLRKSCSSQSSRPRRKFLSCPPGTSQSRPPTQFQTHRSMPEML